MSTEENNNNNTDDHVDAVKEIEENIEIPENSNVQETDTSTPVTADITTNLWEDLMKGTDDGNDGTNNKEITIDFNFENDFENAKKNETTVDTNELDSDFKEKIKKNATENSIKVNDDENEDGPKESEVDPQNNFTPKNENKINTLVNESTTADNGVARARPRPSASNTAKPTNPFNIALKEAASKWEKNEKESENIEENDNTANPFASEKSTINIEEEDNRFKTGDEPTGCELFNPFATINDENDLGFDPFQTIHDDDEAFPLPSTDTNADDFLNNPFGDPAADQDENFANFADLDDMNETEPKKTGSFEESFDEPEPDNLEPLPPYHPRLNYDQGWNLLLRQPFKKKLTQNRFWKPAYVRIFVGNNNIPMIKIYPNEKDQECLYELTLQPTHNICNLGLQQLDQFGKCHTIKIQQMNYKETVGVKTDRIAPTISDLTRVRDLKGLKDLMHKPKATMILDHASNAIELLKFGTLDYNEVKSFINAVEDLLFTLKSIRGKSASYTKDEITVDVQDEYYADIDKDGHITNHKARVRIFCLAFLSESPIIEIGINDKRRRGKEIVGRLDIIPIKTEEWIRIEDYELHGTIDKEVFEETKVVKLNPLDAVRYELLRFRVRPRINIELPLQIRVQTSIVERHIEVRIEVMVTGYYSNSRRAAQTPCEDIQIRFPIPEDWVYLFRVEKRFKYGAVHSSKRKAGKIKGLERLTAFAQGILPPSLIEVSTGLAKYEQAFHAVVWRIDQLPERNEGAYKTHLMAINIDLAPHDKMPEELNKFVNVEYSMANSTVSRAQVRSIAISNGSDEPADKWVRHLAKYEYTIEMEFTDKVKPQSEDIMAPLKPSLPAADEADSNPPKAAPEDESENSSSESD